MRPKIKIDGIDLDIGISKINIIDCEQDMLHLDEQRDGTWELTVSKGLAPKVVDRVKAIHFDQFDRAAQPCYAVWSAAGMITTLRPRNVNEIRHDGSHHGGFIHFDRHPGESWEFHTCDTFDQKIETRKIKCIHFKWNVYK